MTGYLPIHSSPGNIHSSPGIQLVSHLEKGSGKDELTWPNVKGRVEKRSDVAKMQNQHISSLVEKVFVIPPH